MFPRGIVKEGSRPSARPRRDAGRGRRFRALDPNLRRATRTLAGDTTRDLRRRRDPRSLAAPQRNGFKPDRLDPEGGRALCPKNSAPLPKSHTSLPLTLAVL